MMYKKERIIKAELGLIKNEASKKKYRQLKVDI